MSISREIQMNWSFAGTLGAVSILFILGHTGFAETTIDEVRLSNAASQASVITLQARVEAVIRFNPATNMAGNPVSQKYVIDYLRSGEKERIKELEGPLGVRDTIRDVETSKGSMFQPERGENTINQGMRSRAELLPVLVNPWEWALFQMPRFDKPLSKLIEASERKSLSEDGRKLVTLDLQVSQGRYQVDVDPSVNYLPRKLVADCSLPKGVARFEGEIISFQEVVPGVFFPKQLTHVLSYNGKWLYKAEAILSNIRINQPLPSGTFQYAFPPGTLVADYERNVSYTVGRGGNPGKLHTFVPSLGTVNGPAPDAASVGTATPAEEGGWPWYRYVLVVSMVMLGLGLYRWRRRINSRTM